MNEDTPGPEFMDMTVLRDAIAHTLAACGTPDAGDAAWDAVRDAAWDAARAADAAYAAWDAAWDAARDAAYAVQRQALAQCADIVRQHYPEPPELAP